MLVRFELPSFREDKSCQSFIIIRSLRPIMLGMSPGEQVDDFVCANPPRSTPRYIMDNQSSRSKARTTPSYRQTKQLGLGERIVVKAMAVVLPAFIITYHSAMSSLWAAYPADRGYRGYRGIQTSRKILADGGRFIKSGDFAPLFQSFHLLRSNISFHFHRAASSKAPGLP